ncbi:hypothetical protein ACF3DV_05550 [Chlorogloeopsis fritschii PCC 9212]|nr:hypothetical protein [Chlorogloeopsis fritschii]
MVLNHIAIFTSCTSFLIAIFVRWALLRFGSKPYFDVMGNAHPTVIEKGARYQHINTTFRIVNASTRIVNASAHIVNASAHIVNASTRIVNASAYIVNASARIVNVSARIVNVSTEPSVLGMSDRIMAVALNNYSHYTLVSVKQSNTLG